MVAASVEQRIVLVNSAYQRKWRRIKCFVAFAQILLAGYVFLRQNPQGSLPLAGRRSATLAFFNFNGGGWRDERRLDWHAIWASCSRHLLSTPSITTRTTRRADVPAAGIHFQHTARKKSASY